MTDSGKGRPWQVYRRLLLLAALALLVLSASRLVLVAVLWERVAPTGGLPFILLQGLRFDLVWVGQFFGLALLLAPWLRLGSAMQRFGRLLLPLFVAVVCAGGFFVEAATLDFIREYDSRPNYLFVEYLAYPREVFAMLGAAYLPQLLGLTAGAALVGGLAFRWLRQDPTWRAGMSVPAAAAMTLVVGLVLFATIRSTLDHRPINPSIAAFSNDALVNQLAFSSPYGLAYAIYEKRRDGESTVSDYGDLDETTVVEIIRREAGLDGEPMLDPAIPTLREQVATHRRERPLNLVIVVQESLGAEFVGRLGGKQLTPKIDRLADHGLWLQRLYATGIRSVRGLEAVSTGFPPTPQLSVVKLAETQTGFFTLAELLGRAGYATEFIYGGRAHFDNMSRFFLNNGFERVTEQPDFEDPVWVGEWGVADEELYRHAHQELLAAGDRPVFQLIFTTTHHAPFDIPPDRIAAGHPDETKQERAVRYVDQAFGRFVETARASAYWDDTVIYMTADHNSRVYGDHLVPIHRYHIPGLILGGPVAPRAVPGITSQIDLLPTLLSLLGIDSVHPAIGRDLTLPRWRDGAGRAMMQFNGLQAFLDDDRTVVLMPGQEPRFFRFDPRVPGLSPAPADPALARRALAYAHWGPLVIRQRAYRLP